MGKLKVRATRHNGRVGEHGVYKAGHNDRSFDPEEAEHIDQSRSYMNVYWDMYQGYNVIDENGIRPERKYNFEQIEASFYREKFGDSVDAQNERHRKSRHIERIRTIDDIRLDPKTCPEETVYQLGTKDGHEDAALFALVVAEVFEEIEKRYGDHIKILDWALHMDEATPHIHERHVFFADDGHGMNFPKQEKACQELGFVRPDPDKKAGKKNNAKISFDEEIRKLYIEIAEKHGVLIEKIPLKGKEHLEKNDYILAKQKEEIEARQEQIEELTLKVSDLDSLVENVSEIAYEKACEVLTDEIAAEIRKEDIAEIEATKEWLAADERKAPKETRNYAIKQLSGVQDRLRKISDRLIGIVRNAFSDSQKKKFVTAEIVKKAKPSVAELLQKKKDQVKALDELKKQNSEINKQNKKRRENSL